MYFITDTVSVESTVINDCVPIKYKNFIYTNEEQVKVNVFMKLFNILIDLSDEFCDRQSANFLTNMLLILLFVPSWHFSHLQYESSVQIEILYKDTFTLNLLTGERKRK